VALDVGLLDNPLSGIGFSHNSVAIGWYGRGERFAGGIDEVLDGVVLVAENGHVPLNIRPILGKRCDGGAYVRVSEVDVCLIINVLDGVKATLNNACRHGAMRRGSGVELEIVDKFGSVGSVGFSWSTRELENGFYRQSVQRKLEETRTPSRSIVGRNHLRLVVCRVGGRVLQRVCLEVAVDINNFLERHSYLENKVEGQNKT